MKVKELKAKLEEADNEWDIVLYNNTWYAYDYAQDVKIGTYDFVNDDKFLNSETPNAVLIQ